MAYIFQIQVLYDSADFRPSFCIPIHVFESFHIFMHSIKETFKIFSWFRNTASEFFWFLIMEKVLHSVNAPRDVELVWCPEVFW